MIRPEVVSSAAAAPKIGHGLGSTMWLGFGHKTDYSVGIIKMLENTTLPTILIKPRKGIP